MPVRLVSQEEPLPGYRLLERLGRGGFGEVWKVEAPGGLLKAMKFVFGDLDSADEDGRPAEQELKALHRVKSIRHPYILSLERFDILEGQLIIVMELADRNLWDRFRECRAQGMPGVPREELLRYLEETAEALDLMNNHYQIQHLDVKPQNIFLVHNHVKVADFGLAKLFEGERGTVTGGVTPVYAAPETFEGWVSRFTDQYSLAIVYQELLTGIRPITGANTKQLLHQHLHAPPDLSPLPEADRPAVGRALAKKPDDRWPNCSDLIRAIRQGGPAAPPAGEADSGLRTRIDTPMPAPTPPPAAKPPEAPPRPAVPRPGSGVISPMVRSPVTSPPVQRSSAAPPTPGPALVTPRLITPQGSGSAGHTLQRPQIFQTARMSSLGIAPPEKTGDGALVPALVVAVGHAGLGVLKRLRKMVRDRFGGPDAFPVLRFLYIDTDPDAVAASQGPEGLDAREVVLARLNRPAHYLQGGGPASVESWMPPGILYKLPKNPGPAGGVRAFGRLALLDNYRLIAQRIRQEIETFLCDDPLEKAARETGLGLRSNRARAYVLAGLGGGTGSGMAVDLAYVLKHELRSVGYNKPEAVGVFLLPPADPSLPKTPALANAYAALTEVRHFHAADRYQCRFDPNEAPVVDPEGPFTRHTVAQLPKVPKEREQRSVFGQLARGLFVELLTPAGRVTELLRPRDQRRPSARAFGLHRITWPRRELLAAAARRFVQRMLDRWAGRETAHLKEPVRQWLAEQWVKQRLDPVSVVARYHSAARAALGEDPSAVFEAAVDTLRTRTPGAVRADAVAAASVLDQLLKLVGKPDTEHDTAGSLEVAVRAADKKFAKELEETLATLAVSFIEQPQYRLAGAEEALAQTGDRLKEAVDGLDRTRAELAREVRDLFARLLQLLGGMGTLAGRRSAELVDALRAYPDRRLQLIQVDVALSLYRAVLGNLPDYLRDVNYCRNRLGEMADSLAAAPTPAAPSSEEFVLPPGCKTLDEAADQFLGTLDPEDLLGFDQALQAEVARKFRGVVNVCLKPPKTADFLALLADRARGFLDGRLEQTDPATMLLRYRGDGPELRQSLSEGYGKAAPGLAPAARGSEVAVLAAPDGLGGDRLRQLAAEACPGVQFVRAPIPDDVVIWREFPRVELAELPQMADHAREAYEAQLTADVPPHTRTDVPWGGAGDP